MARLKIDVLTLFPALFEVPLQTSIVGRGIAKGHLDIQVHDLRDFTTDAHRTIDDAPYGGGPGMALMPEPMHRAFTEQLLVGRPECRVVLTTPQGERLTQRKVETLARAGEFIIVADHYEGVDERIREQFVTDEISIGDYVLTGGELPALIIIDAVARLIPGVLGNEGSAAEDSFTTGLLEHPHYTRPADFLGQKVPDDLVVGHHEQVRLWRRRESLRRTYLRRPDLLARVELTEEDRRLLAELDV